MSDGMGWPECFLVVAIAFILGTLVGGILIDNTDGPSQPLIVKLYDQDGWWGIRECWYETAPCDEADSIFEHRPIGLVSWPK